MTMKSTAVCMVAAALILVSMHTTTGLARNLSVNPEVTAKIRAEDKEFLKNFDVYQAAVLENPTALLLDPKDEHKIASRLWGEPLKEEDIVYAIARLDDQYLDPEWRLSFEPRALNVVNRKGEVVGYLYTSLNKVFMNRKKDGRVTVFVPTYLPRDDGDDENDAEFRP